MLVICDLAVAIRLDVSLPKPTTVFIDNNTFKKPLKRTYHVLMMYLSMSVIS